MKLLTLVPILLALAVPALANTVTASGSDGSLWNNESSSCTQSSTTYCVITDSGVHSFDIQSASLTVDNSGDVSANILMNFGDNNLTPFTVPGINGVTFSAADMLITAGSSEYALVLDAHNGLQTGGLYYLGSVQNLSSITQTAQAALGNPGGNYRNSLPVWATAGATLLGTAPKQDFTITYLGGDGKNSPQYDISISDITGGSALYTAGTTGNLSFELASATCGNGVVYGSVPEPGTLALMGTALVGLAFLRRGRRNRD